MTPQQEKFAEEYIVNGFNAAAAARAAGYSERSARSQGNRLLTYADVQKYIRKAIDDALSVNRITLKKQILDKLMSIAFGEPETKENRDGEIVGVSFRDNLKALELLGKYMTMFSDKVDHNHSGVVEHKVLSWGEVMGGDGPEN